MKYLVLSDIHGSLENLKALKDVASTCQGILFAGDFAECFKTETSLPVLKELIKLHEDIYAVLGNCDEPEFIENLEDSGINAERILNYSEGLAIIGSGGGTIFTNKTPNERTEEDILSDYSILGTSDETWPNLIVISHNPPKDTKCDQVNESLHAGSALFRDFIEKVQPLLVVTGHIHEGRGIDKIGNTTIINPGSLLEGYYGMVEITKSSSGFEVKPELLKL